MISKEKFASMQDHSILEANVTIDQTREKCEETLKYGFAATYVHPCHVKYAKSILGDKALVGTVVGFPLGNVTTETKLSEAMNAIDNGAGALDCVINISMLLSGNIKYVEDELAAIVKAVKGKNKKVLVKIIIECCYLTQEQKVQACEAVCKAGADYIKTSTGYGTWGCRVGDIRLMRKVCKGRVKIKAAADMKDLNQALAMIDEGAEIIGENSGVKYLQQWDSQMWFDK